jgi:hypothetical protein
MADEDLQHPLHRRLQVEGARERLADLEEGRQAPGVAGDNRGVGRWFRGGHWVSYIPDLIGALMDNRVGKAPRGDSLRIRAIAAITVR